MRERFGVSDKQAKLAIEMLKENVIIHREGSDRKGMLIIDKKLGCIVLDFIIENLRPV